MFGAVGIEPCNVRRRLRARQQGLRAVHVGAIGGVIELVKRLTRFYQAAFGEQPLLDDSRNLGTDLGDDKGIGATGQLTGQRHRLRLEGNHGHLGCRTLRGGWRLLLPAGNQAQPTARRRHTGGESVYS